MFRIFGKQIFWPGCQKCILFDKRNVLSCFRLKNLELRKHFFPGFSDSRFLKGVSKSNYVSRGLIEEKVQL